MKQKRQSVIDRCNLLGLTRSELVGPSRFSEKESEVKIEGDTIRIDRTHGPIFVRNTVTDTLEEVLYDRNEGPTRKYGAGVLHPTWQHQDPVPEDELGDNTGCDSSELDDEDEDPDKDEQNRSTPANDDAGNDSAAPPVNRYKQATMGISFCVKLSEDSKLIASLPAEVKFHWQQPDDAPFPVNGIYRPVNVLKTIDDPDKPIRNRGEIRSNAFPKDSRIELETSEIRSNPYLVKPVEVSENNSQSFDLIIRSRRLPEEGHWLITMTLRNQTETESPKLPQSMLFQAYFDVKIDGGGKFVPYPDAPKSTFDDPEHDSLRLLYRNSSTWAIGHNCAAGWHKEKEGRTSCVFADVFPVVETPSMTPDIEDSEGNSLQFSMMELADLDATGTSATWRKLDKLGTEYANWVHGNDGTGGLRSDVASVDPVYRTAAEEHIAKCEHVQMRITRGIDVLRKNENARIAFRLANKAMVLQQIATKKLAKRELIFDPAIEKVKPAGDYKTPFQIYSTGSLGDSLGNWRAFQLAFLLMNIPDFLDEGQEDYELLRENVELIWFPTGGGKTEAYLGVAAYSLFLSRLEFGDRTAAGESPLPVDGTNILMRYTLRMLTTQQFQRAAALICSMEHIRQTFKEKEIPGGSFSLGLWIGGTSSPNKNKQASAKISSYRNDPRQKNSPLIVTECPWCRSQLGKANLEKPKGWNEKTWKLEFLKGVLEIEGVPRLCCSDSECAFYDGLPIQVVDEQIYDSPPSLVIGTADKFAVLAYRPEARAIFGRDTSGKIVRRPPFLIIQDETHLIAGPLGTLFGLYESVIEKLCLTPAVNGVESKPKIICSTATIRGAREQLISIFSRESFTLFPSPGLDISDSFFGRYATEEDGKTLMPGRMYCGVNASEFVSSQTTQVRVFSSLLVNVKNCVSEENRDPWWTILSFYNSLRELGGALTLFHGDIKSRMKFLTRRDRLEFRRDPMPEELSGRLEQSEIIDMLEKLNATYPKQKTWPIDACLASSIIEVGVDIDRLSLMAVVGQPKNTAQYIQVTGRIGRRWWERPGLVFTLYSSTKIRDKSHFEHFYSYHTRLYEQVEPTSATPFSRASLDRAAIGVMLLYARAICPDTRSPRYQDFAAGLEEAKDILVARCKIIEKQHAPKQIAIIEENFDRIARVWDSDREEWEKSMLRPDDSVLIRWPGQFATLAQKLTTFEIPSSLRQVDKAGELEITKHYLQES